MKTDLISSIHNGCITKEEKELGAFVIFHSLAAKHLLEVKGFDMSKTFDNSMKRVALLHTEISELIDAQKKGKGAHEEGMELADIIIRLMNIPIVHHDSLNALILAYAKSTGEHTTNFKLNLCLRGGDVKAYRRKNKFIMLELCNEMHSVTSTIRNLLIELFKAEKENSNVRVVSCAKAIIKRIFDMIILCEAYAEIAEIEKKVHELVEEKMRENFKRPVNFNQVPGF